MALIPGKEVLVYVTEPPSSRLSIGPIKSGLNPTLPSLACFRNVMGPRTLRTHCLTRLIYPSN